METNIMYKITEVEKDFGLSEETIRQYISYQWIVPANPEKCELDDEDIARIILINEMKEDLGVNDESIPIILHLIDELNHLHLELKKEMRFQ